MKKEILKKHYEKKFPAQKYKNRVNLSMDEDWIKPAMDEYAKKVGIAFARWVSYQSNPIYACRPDGNYAVIKPSQHREEDQVITAEELFNLFLQDQQNNKP